MSIAKIQAELQLATTRASKYRDLWSREVLNREVAGTLKGLKPQALAAVQRDAAELLTVDDNGHVVPVKGGQVSLDGLERHLRKTAPFYFTDAASSSGASKHKEITAGDQRAFNENLEGIAKGDVIVVRR